GAQRRFARAGRAALGARPFARLQSRQDFLRGNARAGPAILARTMPRQVTLRPVTSPDRAIDFKPLAPRRNCPKVGRAREGPSAISARAGKTVYRTRLRA